MDVLTVGGLARLSGITVRTLHHYDEIGLVVPGGRTAAGYRTYGMEEIERLQEVLFFTELGFALDEIKRIVERPGYSRTEALLRQRDMLESRAEHLLALIDTVDQALRAERTGVLMSNEDAPSTRTTPENGGERRMPTSSRPTEPLATTRRIGSG